MEDKSYLLEEEVMDKEVWTVTNDEQAEWIIEKCNEELVEIERYEQSINAKIEELKVKLEKTTIEKQRKIDWRNYHLASYFENVDDKFKKKAKTQEKYRLPSGEIIKKYPSPKLERKEQDLLNWIKNSGMSEYIETKEAAKWGELKKKTIINGSTVVFTETGEVIDGVVAVERPPTIEFKSI